MTDNQVIHEKAFGLKWGHFVPQQPDMQDSMIVAQNIRNNPDYTQPEHYCRLMDWMREDRNRVIQINRVFSADNFFRLTRQQQVSLIAQAIREGVLK